MNQFQQSMQRGRQGGFLRTACDLGLLLGGVLWIMVQLALLPHALPAGDIVAWVLFGLSLLVSIGLALGCAVVLPALLAIIVPFTPAGQLLQETRRSTWGFPVMVAAAGYLAYYGYQLFSAYWSATLDPALVAADPRWPMTQTLATLILAVVVPALAFSWSSPLTWAAEVQQAHMVKQLRMQQAADLALAKASYLRALDKLRAGLSNCTAAERAEVLAIITGLQRAQNQTLRGIADTFRTLAGVELAAPTLDDATIVEKYGQIAGLLEERVLDIEDRPEALAEAASIAVGVPGARASEVAPWRPPQNAPAPAPARSPAPVAPQGPPGSPASDREALTAARRVLTGAWTRSSLEAALDCSKTKANQLIAAWRAAGEVVELTENRHHYSWAEED